MNINIITIVIMAVIGLAALAMGCYMAYCAGWRDGRATGYKDGYARGSEFDRVMGYNEGLNDGIRQGRETCAVTNGKIDGCEHYGQHGRCRLMSKDDNPRLCTDECRGIGRRAVNAVVMALFAAFTAVTQAATVDWSITVRREEVTKWGTFVRGNTDLGSGSTVVAAEEYLTIWADNDGGYGATVFATQADATKAADAHTWGAVATVASIAAGETLLTDSSALVGDERCVMRATLSIADKPTKPGPGGGIEPGTIPEPTSGLLVLAGVGLLALKRKEVAE